MRGGGSLLGRRAGGFVSKGCYGCIWLRGDFSIRFVEGMREKR